MIFFIYIYIKKNLLEFLVLFVYFCYMARFICCLYVAIWPDLYFWLNRQCHTSKIAVVSEYHHSCVDVQPNNAVASVILLLYNVVILLFYNSAINKK